jgi:hypothetical protein
MEWSKMGKQAALTGALALGQGFGMVSQAAVTNAQTTPPAAATTEAASPAAVSSISWPRRWAFSAAPWTAR